jgi:hypothetical protein
MLNTQNILNTDISEEEEEEEEEEEDLDDY